LRILEDYRGIVDDSVLTEIYKKARKFYGKKAIHINSTYYGGGVAEMLNSLIPLMNDVGIQADWRILRGTNDFFEVTKKFHNALQGGSIRLTEIKKRLYIQANEDFSSYCHIDADFVMIHDPQPLPLIRFYKKRQPWVWRCHVDLSEPNQRLWNFLKGFILRYDEVIISNEKYRKKHLPVTQKIVYPAIDPLSPKNVPLDGRTIKRYLEKFDIPMDKPLITQISRFDKWKDPEGVIEVFKRVKEKIDARLVLCGSMATDDPEGWVIYQRVKRKAGKMVGSGDIILINSENNILVNVLQHISDVIIQKSLREGFGLTVTEGMWKQRPVIASNVGGIPIQIEDGVSGFLCEPTDIDCFVDRIITVLKDKKLAEELGKNARERVRQKFLITRLLSDHLSIMSDVCEMYGGNH